MQARSGMTMFRPSPEELSEQEVESVRSGCECRDPSLAVQSQKEESDINEIVRRFGLTGKLPDNVRVPTYQDFDDVFDFQSAMNAVASATQSFMAMPADVRQRFGNDPQKFLEFCSKEENIPEMIKLGLAVEVKVEEPPKPSEVVVVEDRSTRAKSREKSSEKE